MIVCTVIDHSRMDFPMKTREKYSKKHFASSRLYCRGQFWPIDRIGIQINIRPRRIPGDIGDQKEGVVRNYQIADN